MGPRRQNGPFKKLNSTFLKSPRNHNKMAETLTSLPEEGQRDFFEVKCDFMNCKARRLFSRELIAHLVDFDIFKEAVLRW